MSKNKKQTEKNRKLAGENIRIRVNRLVNNSPVALPVFQAELKRDRSNNTIIFNDEKAFQEELPGMRDSLVTDILYKLESRGLTKEQQLDKVKKAIRDQDTKIKSEKDGYIGKDNEKIKINIHSEKKKLRILKCVLYTVENLKGDGFYETIEEDGMRCLHYLIIDGNFFPYYFKMPTSEGEPVILVPDVVQRKKIYKDNETEAIQDFNESQDPIWKGILGTIKYVVLLVWIVSLIVWTLYLARWNSELYDEDLTPKLQAYELEIAKTKAECIETISTQYENNEVLIDYAKNKLIEEQKKPEDQIIDKANIKI